MSQIQNTERPFVMLRRTLNVGVVATILSTAAWARPVSAQEDARSADVAAAREIAIEGLKLADLGQCGQAIERLSRAEKLHHAPIVLARLGECEIAEGKFVDGTESLRRLLREPLPNNPASALLKARERAQVALDAAKPKIAFLSISVREPENDVTVTIDGQLVPVALFDRGRPTDPGDHIVEASAPGYLKATRQVTLGSGEKQELSFKLATDPQAAPNVKEPSEPETLPKTQPSQVQRHSSVRDTHQSNSAIRQQSDGSSYAPSYILWSVGTAAAAVGGVFGYLALKNKNELDKQCTDNHCPAALSAELDTAKRDALVSTVLLGSGAAALAIGTVAYLLTTPSDEKPPSSANFSAQPMIGLGQVGVLGTF